jgi:KUP system potassium uptake protein
MVLWFLVIAMLGGIQVAANPIVLRAISPLHALGFVVQDPIRAFFTLGTVVLAITGAEALYADMGHSVAAQSPAPGWAWRCRR